MSMGTRPRVKTRRIATLVLGVALGACAGESVVPAANVRDSVGVRIVEHPAGLDLPVWTIGPEPEALIGRVDDADPAQQFSQIRGAVRLSDGRIVVGDWGSREARYYGASGTHLRTVGGRGEGPGELRNLYSIDRLHGDTVLVGGWPIGTRYWFDANGDFIRNQVLGPWFPGMLGRTLVQGQLVLDTYANGSYGNTLEFWAAQGTDDDLTPEGVVEIVSADGARADTIGVIRGETWHKRGVLRDNFAMHALPFSPVGLVAWSEDRVFIGHTDVAEFRAYSLDGTPTMIVRWEAQAVSVTRQDRRDFAEEVIDSRRGNQNVIPHYRRWLSEIEYPELKPLWGALVSDEDGNVWMKHGTSSDAPTAGWTIFGPNGIAVAQASLPADLEVLEVDATHVLAKRTNELDVETVLSYRLAR